MALEKILGTNTVKENLMIAGRNFDALGSGGVEAHNIDVTAHADIRQLINNFTPHLSDLVTDADGVHGLKIEEGTWVPIFKDSSGNLAGGYTYQIGTYYKIGKKVHIEVRIKLSSLGALTSAQNRISGIPFPANANSYTKSILYTSTLIYPTGYTTALATIVDSGANLRIDFNGSNVASTVLAANSVTINTELILTMDYITA